MAIHIFNKKTGKVKTLLPKFPDQKGKKNHKVYSIYKDSNGEILIGTDGGLLITNVEELNLDVCLAIPES